MHTGCRTVFLVSRLRLLSMTDAQLRKYLGLVTPVERLVVRHALKRASAVFDPTSPESHIS